MSGKTATVYILVTVLLIWFFLSYHGTVDLGPNATVGGKTVDTGRDQPLTQRPADVGEAQGGDVFDPAYVDSLPMNSAGSTPTAAVNPLEPPRFYEGG